MAHEIDLGGTIYISSKRAAELMGYTQDYVGQLCRSGAIEAKRVSGLWYVLEDSIRNHKSKADEYKPVPPPRTSTQDLDAAVSFDGKDYISTQRAAKITGYHPDYVGQLARSEKINSRQVGNRWYVDREEIVEHKKHNDSLLAAVQAQSVGLGQPDGAPRREEPKEETAEREELHFNYVQEPQHADLIPAVSEKENEESHTEEVVAQPEGVVEPEEQPIAINRIQEDDSQLASQESYEEAYARHESDEDSIPREESTTSVEEESIHEIPIRVLQPKPQPVPLIRPTYAPVSPRVVSEPEAVRVAPQPSYASQAIAIPASQSNMWITISLIAVIFAIIASGYLFLFKTPGGEVVMNDAGSLELSVPQSFGSLESATDDLRGLFATELYYKRSR